MAPGAHTPPLAGSCPPHYTPAARADAARNTERPQETSYETSGDQLRSKPETFPEKFLAWNAIDRLMSHKKSLVGALYFGRHPLGPPVYNEAGMSPQEAEYARRGPYDLVKPTRWVGTGCMLVHRSVFEDIEKKFPRLSRGLDKRGGNWFTSTEASVLGQLQALQDQLQLGPLDGGKAYKALDGVTSILSRAQAENSLGFGEDVSFCLRASASGHQPHVDMGLICGHLGTFCFGPRTTRPPERAI